MNSLTLAFTLATPAVGWPVCTATDVFSGKRVPSLAVCFPDLTVPSSFDGLHHIVAVRTYRKMSGIAARRVVAGMQRHFFGPQIPSCADYEDEAMRVTLANASPDRSITTVASAPAPLPAFVWSPHFDSLPQPVEKIGTAAQPTHSTSYCNSPGFPPFVPGYRPKPASEGVQPGLQVRFKRRTGTNRTRIQCTYRCGWPQQMGYTEPESVGEAARGLTLTRPR